MKGHPRGYQVGSRVHPEGDMYNQYDVHGLRERRDAPTLKEVPLNAIVR